MSSTWYGLYGNFKDLPGGTAKNKVLRDKVFNVVKNPKYDGINAELLRCFTKLLIKKLLVVLLTMNLCQNKN